jgi:hypothetical protein
MERVTGPWDGMFVAAYTAELDGLFYGYAKLCTDRPADVWSAKTILKVATLNGRAGEADALQAVEGKALKVISQLQEPIATDFWSNLIARLTR